MSRGTPEQFRRLAIEGRWDHAVALLRWFDPTVAATTFMSLPFEEQEGLFRTLPIDLAATLVESFPSITTPTCSCACGLLARSAPSSTQCIPSPDAILRGTLGRRLAAAG
jgi:hypothetical protein